MTTRTRTSPSARRWGGDRERGWKWRGRKKGGKAKGWWAWESQDVVFNPPQERKLMRNTQTVPSVTGAQLLIVQTSLEFSMNFVLPVNDWVQIEWFCPNRGSDEDRIMWGWGIIRMFAYPENVVLLTNAETVLFSEDSALWRWTPSYVNFCNVLSNQNGSWTFKNLLLRFNI